MAQTVEEVLRTLLGQQSIQIAVLTVQVQTLQEQLAALQAEKAHP